MLKILSRYILKEAAAYFILALFTFTGILLTVRMLRLASLIINKGVEVGQIVQVFLAIIPAFMEVAIPLATLLGVMLAFGRLSGDSEVIVMRASGVSILQLVRPILFFGILCGLVSLGVTHWLSPWGFQILQRTLFDIARSKSTAGLEPGIFNKLGNLTLYADEIDYRTGGLKRVLIDDKRDPKERKVITATHGEIVSNEVDRTITLRLFDGSIHEQVEGKYVVTDYDSNSVGLSSDEAIDPDTMNRGRSNRELTLGEINDEIARYEALLRNTQPAESAPPAMVEPTGISAPNLSDKAPPLTPKDIKRKVRKLRVEGYRRFSMPFASFILALIALPLGIQQPRSQRTWGAGLSAMLGLLVFTLYYGLLSVGVAMAESGKIPALLGLWLPNLVATTIAGYATWKMGTEQWQSIAQRFEDLLKSIVHRFQTRVSA